MKLRSNTILITGGASGIGYELTKQLTALGNTILITGRDQPKMDRAKAAFPKIHTFRSRKGRLPPARLWASGIKQGTDRHTRNERKAVRAGCGRWRSSLNHTDAAGRDHRPLNSTLHSARTLDTLPALRGSPQLVVLSEKSVLNLSVHSV